MKRVLFIDRDGTLILEPEDEQIDSLEKLEFYPGVFSALRKIVLSEKFELVMVTNQDGLGTERFPEAHFWPAHNKMMKFFANEGITFSNVFIDQSMAHENKPTRKPGTGMLLKYLSDQYDMQGSFVIGDRITDIQLACNLNSKGILLGNEARRNELNERQLTACALITSSWEEIATFLSSPQRIGKVRRTTRETDISVELKLEGKGLTKVLTGIGFLDHMLDQLGRHGQLDLDIDVKGDLHIDEHHTIEDTALALGEAFALALRDKRGMERYGFTLPMDDSLAQVAIDFGGRPWLVWEVEFRREKIGEMPTEMFFHFFKSFSDAARCNLNIKAEGSNEHHKIEAIFKAFAKAIKMAVRRNGDLLPTTKGII